MFPDGSFSYGYLHRASGDFSAHAIGCLNRSPEMRVDIHNGGGGVFAPNARFVKEERGRSGSLSPVPSKA